MKISQQNLSDLEVADTLITVAECLETYNNLLSKNNIADICGLLYHELDTNYPLAVQVNKFGIHLEDLLSGISCANEVRDFFVNSSKFQRSKFDVVQPRGLLTTSKLDTVDIIAKVDALIPEISESLFF